MGVWHVVRMSISVCVCVCAYVCWNTHGYLAMIHNVHLYPGIDPYLRYVQCSSIDLYIYISYLSYIYIYGSQYIDMFF